MSGSTQYCRSLLLVERMKTWWHVTKRSKDGGWNCAAGPESLELARLLGELQHKAGLLANGRHFWIEAYTREEALQIVRRVLREEALPHTAIAQTEGRTA